MIFKPSELKTPHTKMRLYVGKERTLAELDGAIRTPSEKLRKAIGGPVSVGAKHPASTTKVGDIEIKKPKRKSTKVAMPMIDLAGTLYGLHFDHKNNLVAVSYGGKKYPVQDYCVKVPAGSFNIKLSR